MPWYNINDGTEDFYGGELNQQNILKTLLSSLVDIHTRNTQFAELVLTITVEEDDEEETDQCR